MQERIFLPVLFMLSIFHTFTLFASDQDYVVRNSLDDYLTSTNHPKAILCCGHQTNFEQEKFSTSITVKDPVSGKEKEEKIINYQTDVNGGYMFHMHNGWYTIDFNPDLIPDVVGSLKDDNLRKYFFRPNIYEIVYPEKIGRDLLTTDLIMDIATSLKPGGVMIFEVPFEYGYEDNQWAFDKNIFSGQFYDYVFEEFKEGLQDCHKICEKVLPKFRELGFNEVEFHQSYADHYEMARDENIGEEERRVLTEILKKINLSEQDIIKQGCNPAASKYDSMFYNLRFETYGIAKK